MTLNLVAPPRLQLAPRMPSLIFLNGPAGSGKSEIAAHLMALDSGITSYHHGIPLWAMLDQIVGMNPETNEPYDFADQTVKSSQVLLPPRLGIKNPTVREALVSLGHWVRETFGNAILGTIALRDVNELLQEHDTVVLPATRTLDDVMPFLIDLDPREYVILRVFRPGYDWEGDLGNYLDGLDLPHGRLIDIHNTGTLDELFEQVLRTLGVDV